VLKGPAPTTLVNEADVRGAGVRRDELTTVGEETSSIPAEQVAEEVLGVVLGGLDTRSGELGGAEA
jgi:hypothetical protein